MDPTQALDIQQQLCTLETELYKHESFIKTQQVAVMKLKMLFNQHVGHSNSRNIVPETVIAANSHSEQMHSGVNYGHAHVAIKRSHIFPNASTATADHCIKRTDIQGSADSTGEGSSNRLKRARLTEQVIIDGDSWGPKNAIFTSKKRRAILKVLSVRIIAQ